MFFNFFRPATEKFEDPKLKEFRASEHAQLKDRTEAGFFPVPDAYLAQYSGPGTTKFHSMAFDFTSGAFRSLVIKVLPLRHSIKEFALWSLINHGLSCPSVVFDDACRRLQEITDAAIRDIPTELLVYLASTDSEYSINSSINENLESLKEMLDHDWHHPAVVRYRRLAHDYLECLNESGRLAFAEAMYRLWHTELMLNDKVAPVALDVFPSIALRENEIEEAHRAMRREFAR